MSHRSPSSYPKLGEFSCISSTKRLIQMIILEITTGEKKGDGKKRIGLMTSREKLPWEVINYQRLRIHMYVYIDIYTFTHFKKYVQACEYSYKDIDFYLHRCESRWRNSNTPGNDIDGATAIFIWDLRHLKIPFCKRSQAQPQTF